MPPAFSHRQRQGSTPMSTTQFSAHMTPPPRPATTPALPQRGSPRATTTRRPRSATAPSSSSLPPSSTPLPLVVLLDLDGTLVGRVTSVLCEYDVHRALGTYASTGRSSSSSSRSRSSPGENGVTTRALRDAIVSRLRYGIIRPHVVDFCKGAAGVELYVFTASDDAWAGFFIPCVEAALGIRFNRPLFTRQHCVKAAEAAAGGGTTQTFFLKSIARLRPAIARSLRKRYPAIRGPADLVDRVILVDNTADVMVDVRENARLVVCPTYTYAYVYDVLARVPVDVLHTAFARIVPILQRNGMFPTGTWLSLPGGGGGAGRGLASDQISTGASSARRIDSYGRFAAVYHRRLARLLDAAADPNDAALSREGFFAALLAGIRALVQRGGTFDDAGLRDIRAAVVPRRRVGTSPL